MKDRTAGAVVSYSPDVPQSYFTDVGKGTIGWPAILRQARAQGVKHFFVDQDSSSLPPIESLKVSFAYLRALNL